MEEITERIDGLFSPWQRRPCPGGQVWVLKDGEEIYSRCFGLADMERGVEIGPDTVFHVASVSKQITCMSVLLLMEDGLLDIDDDIRRYIPHLVSFGEAVTVRDLMNNVSGIRDQWSLQQLSGVRMEDVITQRDLITLNARQKSLNFPPRTRYLYSNTNFTYLAQIVEKVSGQPLPYFAQKRIFGPLGMDKTFIRSRFSDLVKNRALSYIETREGFKWLPLNFSNWGATSLHTTARDFLKWAQIYTGGASICRRETMEQMLKVPALEGDAKTTYACGVVSTPYKGRRMINHDGADAGYRASMTCFPDDGLIIMITANVSNLSPGLAAKRIADIILGLEEEPSAGGELYSEEPHPPVKGQYYMRDACMPLSVEEGPGGHSLALGGHEYLLERESGNIYQIKGHPFKMLFSRGDAYVLTGEAPQKLTPIGPADFTGEEIEDLSGLYFSCEADNFFRAAVRDGQVWLSHKRWGQGPLVSVGPGEYCCQWDAGFKIRLIKDGGRIRGMALSTGRLFDLEFAKVSLPGEA